MRATLPVILLLSALLPACASNRESVPARQISQSGALKVHPGLLGQSVPAELQEAPIATANPTPAAAPDSSGAMDPAGLRTERSIYFDFNNADVRSEFDPILQAHARYLAANPQSLIRIDGNADERGTPDFNARLGLKRAENVRQAMIKHGAPGKQIRIKTLGASNPKQKGRDEESWAANRRADVIYEKED